MGAIQRNLAIKEFDSFFWPENAGLSHPVILVDRKLPSSGFDGFGEKGFHRWLFNCALGDGRNPVQKREISATLQRSVTSQRIDKAFRVDVDVLGEDNPKELQDLLDELKASRVSRKRAWENLQELRWVVKDTIGIDMPPPARKTIDLEGRIVKDGVRNALRDRQVALGELVRAIRHFRKIADSKPLTLQGSEYPQAVHELNKAIDRADGLLPLGARDRSM